MNVINHDYFCRWCTVFSEAIILPIPCGHAYKYYVTWFDYEGWLIKTGHGIYRVEICGGRSIDRIMCSLCVPMDGEHHGDKYI